jgi:hypothetical protein
MSLGFDNDEDIQMSARSTSHILNKDSDSVSTEDIFEGVQQQYKVEKKTGLTGVKEQDDLDTIPPMTVLDGGTGTLLMTPVTEKGEKVPVKDKTKEMRDVNLHKEQSKQKIENDKPRPQLRIHTIKKVPDPKPLTLQDDITEEEPADEHEKRHATQQETLFFTACSTSLLANLLASPLACLVLLCCFSSSEIARCGILAGLGFSLVIYAWIAVLVSYVISPHIVVSFPDLTLIAAGVTAGVGVLLMAAASVRLSKFKNVWKLSKRASSVQLLNQK